MDYSSLHQWLLSAATALSVSYEAEEARLIPRMVAAHYLKTDYAGLRMKENYTLTSEAKTHFSLVLDRLLAGEPVQYILGEAHFYGRDFDVTPAVLIPRQETEELVVGVRDALIRLARPSSVLDIGTGSGCIPISLFLELQQKHLTPAFISGLDYSGAALNIARRNNERLGAGVIWEEKDIFQAKVTDYAHLDALVSNPPYIPRREKAEMSPLVYAHEPEMALFVPDEDAVVFYRQIALMAPHWLRPGGLAWVEIHRDFGLTVAQVFEQSGLVDIQVRKDLSGNPRFVTAIRA